MTKIITDENFEETVSNGVVLVDFYATWCGPCKMLSSTIDELSDEYDGKATVAKIDVDSNDKVTSFFGIRGIPTVLIFKNGEQVDQIVGVHDKSKYKFALSKALDLGL